MEDAFTELSRRTAALVAERSQHVVRVERGRRAPASGVVWSADGLVVAAHHSLEDEDELEVGLPSGEPSGATVVGRDPGTDLALLRVAAAGLTPAPWAAAPPAAGQLVLALSRPGVGPRAAPGMITRAGGEYRGPGGGRIDAFVETSLERAPGLSGSLVVGAGGDGVGIAATGFGRGPVVLIPPATLRRVVAALAAHGTVRRGFLGIATFPVRLPAALARATGQELALLVSAVEPESPAARGGLLLGDALVALGGAPVSHPGDLLAALEPDRIGQPLAVRVVRAGEVREVAVTVGARGAPGGTVP